MSDNFYQQLFALGCESTLAAFEASEALVITYIGQCGGGTSWRSVLLHHAHNCSAPWVKRLKAFPRFSISPATFPRVGEKSMMGSEIFITCRPASEVGTIT